MLKLSEPDASPDTSSPSPASPCPCSPPPSPSPPPAESEDDEPDGRSDDEVFAVLKAALARMECPFTWDTPATTPQQIQDITVVNKGHMPMVWNEVVIKVKLAYTHCIESRPLLAPQYIAEAYMRLLPAFDEADELVREYAEALRHLVDATWAHVLYRTRHTCDSGALRGLAAFVDGLSDAKSFNPQQRSALVMVRAKYEHFPDSVPLARKAIALHPHEGHWYTVLAKLLAQGSSYQSQMGVELPGYSIAEQEKAAVTGFEKRKTVESYVMLANAYHDKGLWTMAMKLMKEAVEAYPRSSWVLLSAADMAQGGLPRQQRDVRSALRWLHRALDCPGGDCPAVAYLLGGLLLERGESKEARSHLARAAPAMDQAQELLDFVDKLPHYATLFPPGQMNLADLLGGGVFEVVGTGGAARRRTKRKRF